MFSQKKKPHYGLLYILLSIILIFAVIMLIWPEETENDFSEDSQVVSQSEQTEKSDEGEKKEDKNSEDKGEIEKIYNAYYIVKNDSNIIKIYFSDEEGKLTEVEVTSIVYEMLNTEDQKRFDKGIIAKTREDLNRLIMDFES